MSEFILFFSSGILSGFLGGLFGIGGGIILVPFLSIYTELNLVEASGISLFCIIGTSLSVSYRKLKANLINLDLAMNVETTALIFGFAGSILAHSLPENVIQICFATMVTVLAGNYAKGIRRREAPVGERKEVEVNQFAFQGIIALAGTFAGLLGIGGGALIVPLINKYAKVPIKIATATSAYIMGMTTAGGALGHLMRPSFPYKAAIFALGGVKIGAWIGVEASNYLPDRVIKVCFLLLLIWIAIKMWLVSL
ncbi:sulfite exporter TauE/SafE family protein [bacterium]|nr:sulfite exporter TauE/SafE family protein [bacterium]